VNEQEAFRQADDTNVWVGVKELQERVTELEARLARLAEPEATIARLERELAEAKKEAEKLDVCWHCNCLLERDASLPHCEDCPSTDDGCYQLGCEEPGCVELAGARLEDA
jgi:uncharacterized coiled-coil protein SlyX